MADKVGSSNHVNMSATTEQVIISQDHQTIKDPASSLPPLPHFQAPSLFQVCPPSDQVFQQAAAIFQQLHAEKPVIHQLLNYGKKTDIPPSKMGDRATQTQAYQLAFNTLKYQDLLENVIADSCFHTYISCDLLPLAMVMLFDFQDRKFLLSERPTKEDQEVIQEVRDLESSMKRCKTKLAAALARFRVKHYLRSVSCFLCDPVRAKQHRAKSLPHYTWINTLGTSLEEVCEALQSAGLREANNMVDLQESVFCRDPLCPDTLIFSQNLYAQLQDSILCTQHILNIQDRSVCVAVSAIRPLLFEKGDVLVVGSFSAVTVAHVAVAAAERSARVLVCGADHTASQIEEIQKLLTQMHIKNVRVLSEPFYSLNEWNAAVQRLKVIAVLPQCSSSALNDPVPTIHSEHGDWDLLPELSHGSVSKSKIQSLSSQQARLLAHALTFPKVQTVVYCTRSEYPEENEQLVKRVLEKTHTNPKLLPFRVNGPIFPEESPSEDTSDSRFFRLKPSQLTNGCFIARLSRQADPTKVETVQDVLARAAAKGLLGGIMPSQTKPGKKGKSKKNRAASASSKHSTSSSPERQTEREQDPEAPEEEGGEEDCKEGDEEEEKVQVEGQKGGKKKRGHKGRKRHSKKKTAADSKHKPKNNRKKSTKRKVSQSQHKKNVTRSKPRRIPRLTLTLMSSATSSHLSPIAALAHKLSGNPRHAVLGSEHPSAAPPPPPAPHTPSKRPTAQPERALTDTAKPARKGVRAEQEVAPQKGMKAAEFVLPPISAPSSSCVRSKSGSSVSPRLSSSELEAGDNVSASSSPVSLPEL
ncbi:putative methyltransferase NSUN7 [Parambassis ranga]|uniref:Methyltransferase NSUN7 n=1 Tax=Parambassis ranga TaxID=210632 RepID=A0A6P7K4J0_9TELE|nr:putative methyltransferase NSUN7 [Parambassis ranga]